MLLETALEEVGLDGGKQVLGVEVSDDLTGKDRHVSFGGAGTIGDHSRWFYPSVLWLLNGLLQSKSTTR
jgi:hypothetical protein